MFQYKEVNSRLFILITFLLFSIVGFAQDKNEEALAKTADDLFKTEEYKQAKDVYSQLISLYPKNENYNCRFGACIMFADKDKEFGLKFLEYAVTQPNVDVEAFYYMGRGYQYNYKFEDAIVFYKKYLAKVSPSEKNPLPAKDGVRYCENGRYLMKDIKEPSILGKYNVNSSDFLYSIKISGMGGKVLNAPKDLQSSMDKKMGYFPVMYVNSKTDEVYFSSYGSDGRTGLDIYIARVKSDGNLDKAVKLSSQINTQYDDGFPFMNEDETEFYFASKGHNSMGGYDIFKSNYNSLNNTFGPAENLDYSINTTDNDYMYATVKKEGIAFFASDRNSEKGKTTVFKIDAVVNSVKMTVLNGVFSSKATKSCKITVEDVDRKETVGTYSTKKTSGEYSIRLHVGGNYKFLIEPFGVNVAYQGSVKIPVDAESNLQQEIEIISVNDVEKLVIRNMFGENAYDPNVNLAQTPTDVPEEVPVAHVAEIDMEIESKKLEIQEYIGETKKNANISYAIANEKRELAQKDLAMASQLESSFSLNDNSPESKQKKEELSQLMQDAMRHSNEADAAFSLGEQLDALVTDSEKKLNKYEAYSSKITAAEKLEDGEKMKDVYATYTEDEDLFVKQDVDGFLANSIEEEERIANSYIKKAQQVGEKQVAIKAEISRAKVSQNSTKDLDEKDTIQAQISELEDDYVPLEVEKSKYFKLAESHSKAAQKFKDELATVSSYKEKGLQNDAEVIEVSPEQKKALIASISATSNDIAALIESTSDELKVDKPTGAKADLWGNDDIADNTSSTSQIENEPVNNTDSQNGKEVIGGNEVTNSNENNPNNVENTKATESQNSTTENGNLASDPVNEENNSASTDPTTAENTSSSDSKYFPYTKEYEQPVEDVSLINGERIPLDITSNTGKKQFTREELELENVNLKPAPYQSQFQNDFVENNALQDPKEKSLQLQRINYNWLVSIEKEIAVLSYAKENSSSPEYADMLQSKITTLETQAKQKRNLLALNSKIIKQLEKGKTVAVVEGNRNNEPTSTVNENQNNSAEIEQDNTTQPQENEPFVQGNNDAEKVDNSIPVEQIANTNANTLSNENTAFNNETNKPIKINKPVTVSVPKQKPGQVIVSKIETEKKVQSQVVQNESGALNDLEQELSTTKKKKDRAAKEEEIKAQSALVELEKEKLKLTDQKLADISNTLDILVEDPLSTRPSDSKYELAQKYNTEKKTLGSQLSDLETVYSTTKKKKQKRVIAAEIQEVKNQLEYKNMQSEMALESAREIEEVEVLVLKRVTDYGSEVMVELPEVQMELTPEEVEETKQLEAYKEYESELVNFDTRIENADVLYQEAAEKKKAVDRIGQKLRELVVEVSKLPEDEQAPVMVQIKELQEERARVIMEAEVIYEQAKNTTNDAFYGLNEANAALLKNNNAEDRTRIIALINGNLSAPRNTDIVDAELNPNETEDTRPKENRGVVRIDDIPEVLNADIFELSNQTYYTRNNPIPKDVKLPKGVVLKVQVGAFRNAISPEVFKGFAPIVAEDAGNGLTRYTAGLFRDFTSAENAKTSIRSKGYSDAFIVAYLDGKRITIADARRLIGGEITASEIGSTNFQAPPSTDVKINVNTVSSNPTSRLGAPVGVERVQSRGDLFFTVQVGVYNSSINPSSVFNISPLNSDALDNGLVRYSSGVYGSVTEAINARNKIVQLGISDAFVTAYYNGRRVSVAEAKNQAVQNGGEVVNTVGNSEVISEGTTTPQVRVTNTNKFDVNTKTNSNAPGEREAGKDYYFVQIGPYTSAIPMNEARVILGLSYLGVLVVKNNGTTLYKIGNFTDVSEANELMNDLKTKGLTNPEVVKSE